MHLDPVHPRFPSRDSFLFFQMHVASCAGIKNQIEENDRGKSRMNSIRSMTRERGVYQPSTLKLPLHFNLSSFLPIASQFSYTIKLYLPLPQLVHFFSLSIGICPTRIILTIYLSRVAQLLQTPHFKMYRRTLHVGQPVELNFDPGYTQTYTRTITETSQPGHINPLSGDIMLPCICVSRVVSQPVPTEPEDLRHIRASLDRRAAIFFGEPGTMEYFQKEASLLREMKVRLDEAFYGEIRTVGYPTPETQELRNMERLDIVQNHIDILDWIPRSLERLERVEEELRRYPDEEDDIVARYYEEENETLRASPRAKGMEFNDIWRLWVGLSEQESRRSTAYFPDSSSGTGSRSFITEFFERPSGQSSGRSLPSLSDDFPSGAQQQRQSGGDRFGNGDEEDDCGHGIGGNCFGNGGGENRFGSSGGGNRFGRGGGNRFGNDGGPR